MQHVQVYIQDRLTILFCHEVGIPELFVECAWGGGVLFARGQTCLPCVSERKK